MLHLREYDYVPVENDVTFVAQLSYDRLPRIEELVKCWLGMCIQIQNVLSIIFCIIQGPISLTLYLTDAELVKTLSFIENSVDLKTRSNVVYHAVFKDGVRKEFQYV